MKNNLKKLLAAILVITMVLPGITVFADDTTYSCMETKYISVVTGNGILLSPSLTFKCDAAKEFGSDGISNYAPIMQLTIYNNDTKETTYARITGTGASISSTLKLEDNSSYIVTVSYIYDESINKNAFKVGGGDGWADGDWWISSTNNIDSYTVSSTKPSIETSGGTGDNQEDEEDNEDESNIPNVTPSPSISEKQSITRDDGTWFFPVAQQYYQKFSDWCCCPGNDKCILCNSYHSGWGDSAHSGQKGHNGIDLATPTGTPVYAAAPGTFYKGGSNSHSRGYYVVIEHPIENNLSYYSTYQHLNSFNTALSNGQSVEAGDLIGYSGGSGAGSGVHLHFGIVIGNSGKGISGVDTYELWSSSNPWATKPEQTQGRIVNNPADNFPTSTAGATLEAIKMHKGSVHYTFDSSKVDIGFDNTGSGDSSSTTTYTIGTYRPKDTIGLNLRSTPSAVSDSNILASIPYGTTFVVTNVNDGWGKTTYNGNSGWVSLEWATFVSDTTQQPNTSESKYNPQKAVEYAKNHWNDGKGLCAEFASDCLAAGGCTAWNRGCTSLVSQLKKENWGVEYQLTLDSNGYIKESLNSGKIAPGDLIFHYCTSCRDYGDGKPYIHVYVCSEVDSSGYWLGYAHNNAYSGRIYGKGYCYADSCNCSTSIAYVFHMTAVSNESEDDDDNTQWSDWSDWSTTKPTASNTVQVESKTQYGYYHYILQYSNGNCGAYPIDSATFNRIFPSYPTTQKDYHTKYFDSELSKIDTLTYNGTTYNCYANTCCPDSYNYDNGSNASYFYNLGTRTVYRSRTKLPETISVNSVTINKNSVTLEVGATETLTATITPSNATDKTVTWTSSNSSVASVLNGVIKAKAAGTATITVKTTDGNKTATCVVTVKTPTVAVTGVSLNKTSATLTVGGTETLTATVSPNNATNKAVTWTSSNTSVASVSNGVITAKAVGTATITVKTADGNKTATCVVTVNEQPIVEADVIYTIGSASAKPGDSVEVTLSVASDVVVNGLLLDNLTYDKNVFEFVEFADYSDLITTSALGANGVDSANGVISLGYTDAIKPNGQICVIKFRVKDTAEDGEFIIGIDGMASAGGEKLSSRVDGGKITISKWVSGDFDSDEKLDMKDVVHFMNWINFSWTGKYPMVYDGDKDFNKDGNVDMKDVVYFMNYVNFSWTGNYDINW